MAATIQVISGSTCCKHLNSSVSPSDTAMQTKLPPADTPPESPIELAHHKPSTTIHVDDNGVHDFDLRRRQDTIGARKLQKLSRRSIHQRSVSSMSDIPQRRSSDGSEHGSIRKRFSSLLLGTNGLHKSNSGKSQVSFEEPDDPLPDTKKELEVRLNYHLSELDMLKKTLRTANDVIQQHQERYQILQARVTPDMKISMRRQEQMVELARTHRDSYVTFVSFHRRQLERIKHKRIEIEKDAGLKPTLPEVYRQLWGDEEWARLFVP